MVLGGASYCSDWRLETTSRDHTKDITSALNRRVLSWVTHSDGRRAPYVFSEAVDGEVSMAPDFDHELGKLGDGTFKVDY